MFKLGPILVCALIPLVGCSAPPSGWELNSFERVDTANPIIEPCATSSFFCPVQNKEVHWEKEHTFNPSAIVRDDKVYLIYRAEDDYGSGIGKHTSRLGLAVSNDGIHFTRSPEPVLFPDNDLQNRFEFPGGCEDPRIVETEEGQYIMIYTQWNRQMAVLGVAVSDDLHYWEKHGYAFKKSMKRRWSKSGSIVCRREDDKMIATRINGKYWMYWGEGAIHAATSDDLLNWDPVLDEHDEPLAVVMPRLGKFDSALVEPGPAALLTEAGILLLYNGKNDVTVGDPKILSDAYSAGQILFDKDQPMQILARSRSCFLTPERPYEMKGQYEGGTVFIEGLVHFHNQWLLYYGTADSAIGVAVSKENSDGF